MLREGSGPPIVLLHGVLNSENVWVDVIPMLSKTNEMFAFTAMGHRGGRSAPPGATFYDLVDDFERTLDEFGLHQPHLVGSSMGGAIAIELAKRGKAETVCALSPAGCWDVSRNGHEYSFRKLRKVIVATKKNHWLLPVLSRSALFRRKAMRLVAQNGDNLTTKQFTSFAKDALECGIGREWFLTPSNEVPEIGVIDPAPCPIMLAWSEFDRIFPAEINGVRAQELIPQADWRILPAVGHLPMIDNPEIVVETIRDSVNRSG